MRVHNHSAFVLHRRPYSETSLLLDVFSREHGRITLMAKGARRLKSPVRGILQTFIPLTISWTGKSEVQTLTHAECRNPIPKFSSPVWLAANYMNELLIKLLHKHDPHEKLFDVYDEALSLMNQNTQLQEHQLRQFEKHLLREIGYGMVLDKDIGMSPIDSNATYVYLLGRGPVKVSGVNGSNHSQQEHSLNEQFMQQITNNRRQHISGKVLLALAEEKTETSTEFLRESKLLLCGMLQQVLEGRTLYSRNVYLHLHQSKLLELG